jgi:transposase
MEKRIFFGEEILKSDMYHLVKSNKPIHFTYKVDCILVEHGHTVLRLSLYHAELNPIELIWGTVKNWVAEKNVTFKLDDVIKLTDEALLPS